MIDKIITKYEAEYLSDRLSSAENSAHEIINLVERLKRQNPCILGGNNSETDADASECFISDLTAYYEKVLR